MHEKIMHIVLNRISGAMIQPLYIFFIKMSIEVVYLKFLKSVDNILNKFEDSVSAIIFALMCITVFLSVIFRYVLEMQFSQGEEIARYLMIWGIFFGISIGTRQKAHIGVEAFVGLLPPKGQKVAKMISQIIVIGCYIWLFALSLQLINMSLVSANPQLTPQTRMPFWYMYTALVLGFGLAALRGAQVFWKDFISKGKNDEQNGEVQA